MYQFASNCQFNAEDLNRIYQEAFGFRSHGSFVEVGASDGESYSNTCGLADIGWEGIYVEPVKELAKKCRLRHRKNDVSVYNCAARRVYGEFT
jgi:hypothetical protein